MTFVPRAGGPPAARLPRGLGAARRAFYTIALPVLVLAALADYPWLESTLRYVYMLLGFSVIIFVHELGHFLVARACGVKCPVFSVGMGHRLCGWQKGRGFTFGPQPGEEKKDDVAGSDLLSDVDLFLDPEAIGQTDYRISMLPIGGYVRMLGQDDMDPTKLSADPDSYNNKPIWQRMCIISAGVIMNVILAVVIFAIVFKVGIDRPGPVIGKVQYDSPADKAGMKLGDRVLAVNSDELNMHLEFMDIMIASALSNGRDAVHYRWLPYGSTQPREDNITPTTNAGVGGLLMIGVSPIPDLRFPAMTAREHQELARLNSEFTAVASGDRITQINGQPVAAAPGYGFVALYQILQQSAGNPVTLTLHNDDSRIAAADRDITVTPKLMPRDGVTDVTYPAIAGLQPCTAIDMVYRDTPADKAGLKTGDVILRLNELETPTIAGVIAATRSNAGSRMTLVVDRGGEFITVHPTPERTADGGKLGMTLRWDIRRPVIAAVTPDHAGLKDVIPGSVIVAVDGQPMTDWNQVLARVRQAVAPPDAPAATAGGAAPLPALTFTLQPPAGAPRVDVKVPLEPRDRADALGKLEYNLGTQLEIANELQKSDTLTGAVLMGLDDTRKFILQTYLTLHGLLNRTIPADQLHGALGIAKVGHDIQEKGFIHLLFLLGVISVNLAVANFLPLPIVDGGHFLLLIVEKIRGRRLAPRIEMTIQYVGLCLIIGMMLYVTYNDLGLFTRK